MNSGCFSDHGDSIGQRVRATGIERDAASDCTAGASDTHQWSNGSIHSLVSLASPVLGGAYGWRLGIFS